jgi:competence protein ComEA
MKPFIRQGVASATRDPRSALRVAARRLVDLARHAIAWRWGAVAARVVLGGAGIVLLGAIGRSALARSVLSPSTPGPTDAGLAIDADVGPGVGRIPTVPAPAAAQVSAPVVASPIAPTEGAASPPVEAPSRGRATPEDPVYLNQATGADLHRLPGVGPKRAEAILALRARLGHFRQLEDLLKVKGIGRSSLRKLRPLVRLDAPAARLVDAGAGDAQGAP